MRNVIGLMLLATLMGCDDDPVSLDDGVIFLRGNIEIRSQWELDQLRGLERVEGSLSVRGVHDLSPLGDLVEVTETFTLISSVVTDLSGLRSLVFVNAMSINLCPYITVLQTPHPLILDSGLSVSNSDGLVEIAGLQSASFMDINYCANLRSIEVPDLNWLDVQNLPNLELIWGDGRVQDIDIVDCGPDFNLGVLVNIAPRLYDLEIRDQEGLTDFRDLPPTPNLEHMTLDNLPDLESFVGLNGRPDLYNIRATDCEQLNSLAGIDSLPFLRNLTIRGCGSFTSLTGLGSEIPMLYELRLDNNEAFSSLEGLGSAGVGTNLSILWCPQLTTLDGIEGNQSLTHVSLLSCQNLTDLSALGGLPSLTGIQFEALDQMVTLPIFEGFEDLRSIFLLGMPQIEDVQLPASMRNLDLLGLEGLGVTDLSGLSSLLEVTDLDIDGNLSLESLEGLSGLEYVNDLSMSFNSRLPQCDIDDLVARLSPSYTWTIGNRPCTADPVPSH